MVGKVCANPGLLKRFLNQHAYQAIQVVPGSMQLICHWLSEALCSSTPACVPSAVTRVFSLTPLHMRDWE